MFSRVGSLRFHCTGSLLLLHGHRVHGKGASPTGNEIQWMCWEVSVGIASATASTYRSLEEVECSLSLFTRCSACCSLSKALKSLRSDAQCLKNSTGERCLSSLSLMRLSSRADMYSSARGCRYRVFVPAFDKRNGQDGRRQCGAPQCGMSDNTAALSLKLQRLCTRYTLPV